ncbi:MAG TPA: MG2 domain-containing protein [Blastocatellia bacterium]|nr:MG2 domain-containing protein [Blastocatellia bacterium]
MKFARQNRWSRVALILVAVATATLFSTIAPKQQVLAADNQLAAIYRNGQLELNVPYDEATARNRVLNLEILDPNDKPVARLTRPISASRDGGPWKAAVPIDKGVALEDLAWNRLKIGSGDGAKIVSLSEILRVPVVRVFAQRAYAAGSSASVRIITTDSRTGDPLPGSHIKIALADGDRSTALFTGRADALGTAQVVFTLPAATFGPRQLRVTAETALGTVTANQPVQLERRDRILLSTDKPMYQPGQTIHLRALALDGPTRAAAADQPITLEVEDAKGNKVFKRRGRTDRFGIASADFELADEVNFGPYHVRAIVGDDAAASAQEKTVTVDRYVLPKFKVEIELDNDAAKQRASYYSPGDAVSGKVMARYLFGKPLANAEVTVRLTTFDVQSVELARLDGKTDRDGRFAFSSKLPNFLAGRSTEQGSAPVAIAVEVKDTAQHTESKSRDILVSNTPILILAIPESGHLLPGLENRVYILTSYPDGTPAETSLTGNIRPARIDTDSSGVASVSVRPDGKPVTLSLKATDARGRTAQANLKLETAAQTQSLMLRTNQAVYKIGDTLQLETLSTRPRGAVYIDLVKDGQTLITRAIDTNDGRGSLSIDLTPATFGTVEVRAYQITSDADPISDRRLVYVDPADDLKVEVSADRESYKPGDDARINFRATDGAGRPVSAAFGVEIVDEAVFALSDKQPGFEKVFMYLEKELLTPRYEVHQFSFEKVLLDDFDGERPARIAMRERAARVLLAAAGTVRDKDVRAEYGREAIEAKRNEYAALYMQRVNEIAQAVAKEMTSYYESHAMSREGFNADLQAFAAEGAARRKMLEDPWGNLLAAEGKFGDQDYAAFMLRSPGPDRRDGTTDDITVQGYAQRKPPSKTTRNTSFRGRASVEQNAVAGGRAAIEGTVRDEKGNAVSGAKVLARRLPTGKTTWVYTDSRGRFTMPDLAPGNYSVIFEADAYHSMLYKSLALGAGARARIEAATEPPGVTPIALTVYPHSRLVELEMAADGAVGRKRDFQIRKDMAARAAVAGGMPVAAPMAQAKEKNENLPINGREFRDEVATVGGDSPRVRSFFPETLYTNAALITDGQGRASIEVPVADSITTWRVTSLASTARGLLGSSTAPIRVFQDFFVDLDLPVSITEGDVVSVPVAVYNYLPGAQRVSLDLRQDPWFALDNDDASKRVEVGAGEVTVAYFRLKAAKIGEQQLQVTARLENSAEGQPGDAVARAVNVLPNGEERAIVINERLERAAAKDVVIPAGAITDASKIFVKLYPGALSQVVEGLDSILQMPGGCFEQTSSSTYPNVLVMDYLKASKKITPEIQAKAEGYISLGYQRLVTFEVKGGGFSWFGQAPANKILTAYGLMEFSDMSRVHEVDPRLVERTQDWLASQQQPDGSFKPDTYFINEGATTRYNTDVTRITAYIGWSLATTGYKGEAVEKARQFVASHATGKEDAYTLAVIANFAADYGGDKAWIDAATNALAAKATEGQKTAFWKQEGETPTSARESSADLETTALAAQALLKTGQRGGLAKKALDYLTENKDAFGNWQTTQATILSLKAFLLSFTKGTNADTAGTVEVSVDGQSVERIEITKDNNDLLHLVDLKAYTHSGSHKINLSFAGRGGMQYQIVGRYYVPWSQRVDAGAREPLSIDVSYDRTRLAQDEVAKASVRVQNNTAAKAKMIMVDLGIPPGFEPSGEDFAALIDATREKSGGRLEKFTITAKQIILYFDGLNGRQRVEFSFKLRAKFPVRAQTFSSRVYEYYNPTVEDKAKPVEMTVVAK